MENITIIDFTINFLFKHEISESSEKIVSNIKGLTGFSDMIATILPLPDSAPKEIPYIMLEDSEKGISIEISKKHGSISFSSIEKRDIDDFVTLNDYNIYIKDLYTSLQGYVDILRIGFVVSAFIGCKDGVQKVLNKFFNKSFHNYINSDLGINFNHKEKINDIDFNNLSSIQIGAMNDGIGGDIEGIIIIKDLNNQINTPITMTEDLFKKIIEKLSIEKIKNEVLL